MIAASTSQQNKEIVAALDLPPEKMIKCLFFSEANAHPKLSSSRKDFFYSYDRYPEANLPDPIDGGRFHLVTTSNAGKGHVIARC